MRIQNFYRNDYHIIIPMGAMVYCLDNNNNQSFAMPSEQWSVFTITDMVSKIVHPHPSHIDTIILKIFDKEVTWKFTAQTESTWSRICTFIDQVLYIQILRKFDVDLDDVEYMRKNFNIGCQTVLPYRVCDLYA